VSWYYLKRDKGKLEKRFVLSTRAIKASTLRWWGAQMADRGWFKLQSIVLHRFGQGTLLGIYRWFILSFTAYLMAHWTYLATQHSYCLTGVRLHKLHSNQYFLKLSCLFFT